jgi:hypothetical protein
VSVAGPEGGIVGYVRKAAVFPAIDPTTGKPSEASWPVYADDLVTVVGQLVPGKGFVPLGVDPAAIPTIPVRVEPSPSGPPPAQSKTTLYVRDQADKDAWVADLADGSFSGGIGFNGNDIGAGCFAVPVGSRLVLLDRAPQAPNPVIRLVLDAPSVSQLSSLWLAIGSDGRATPGVGVPDWWSSDPQAC